MPVFKSQKNRDYDIKLREAGTEKFLLDKLSANTNTIQEVERVNLESTGTTAAGFGSRKSWYLENGSGNQTEVGRLDCRLTTVTNGAEVSSFDFWTMNAGVLTSVFSVNAAGMVTITGSVDMSSAAGNITLKDNTSAALNIKEATNSYIQLDTTDSSELITFGVKTKFLNDMDVSGQATKLKLLDNSSAALDVTEASNSYLKFVTTNSGEKIQLGVDLDCPAARSLTMLDNSSTAFSIKEGSNVYMRFITTDAGEKIQVSKKFDYQASDFAVTNQATTISIKDNQTAALDITESTNSYLKFVTTDAGEKVQLGVDLDCPAARSITILDNSATSFTIKEGSNVYLRFITTDSGEKIQLSQDLDMPASRKFTLVDNSTAALDITESTNSYLKFITTNAGEKIQLGADLDLPAARKFTILDNSTGALDITEASNSYLKFITTNAGEKIQLGVDLDCPAARSITILDNSATALTIKEATNVYMRFITTNAAEKIQFSQDIDLPAARKITILDNSSAALDITEAANSYLKFITTNAGEKVQLGVDLDCPAARKVTVLDNNAAALDFTESTNSYIKLVTTNSSESVAVGQRLTTTDGVASGTARVVGGRAYSATAASADVSATTSETAFDKNYSIPANTLKAGTVVKVRFQGIATATNSTDTLTIKLYLATDITAGAIVGTTLISMAATDVANSDVFQGEYEIVCRTTGASGTIVGCGTYKSIPAAEGTMTIKDDILASTVVDTTGALIVAATATWSTNSAGNSCRLDVMNVSIV